jgi:hypothetical protein
MGIQYHVETRGKTAFRTIEGTEYSVWRYRIIATGAAEGIPAQLGLAFSRHIDIRDPASHPDVAVIQDTAVDRLSSPDVQYVYRTVEPVDDLQVELAVLAPTEADSFSPLQLMAAAEPSGEWQRLPFRIGLDDPEGLTQAMVGPAGGAPRPEPMPAAIPLDSAVRRIEKATLVPLTLDQPFDLRGRGMAIAKNAFVRQLSLQPGEVEAVERLLGAADDSPHRSEGISRDIPWDLLRAFEQDSLPSLLPAPSAFAEVPIATLQAFGGALSRVRDLALTPEQRVRGAVLQIADNEKAGEFVYSRHLASIANKALEILASGQATPIGMLNLERLEMTPAGVERGELIATIPLAPLEQTAVTHKEWSVTSKEFTSIVSDFLENVSEVGVTDNTELAQSTSSQIQHGNQFNITGTVSGGIPIISGSSTTTFAAQDAASQSATDSRKHATSMTQKASSRSKQEHKITISTKTETGSSETSTRILRNPSSTDSMRIDYFSLMRKWQVRLYRYGLRLTYDVVIPEPAGAMREAYARLSWLRSQIGPFVFPVKPSEITNTKFSGESKEHYLELADQYHVQVPLYPGDGPTLKPNDHFDVPDAWTFEELSFDVPPGYVISEVFVDANLGDRPGPRLAFAVLGSAFHVENQPGAVFVTSQKVLNHDGSPFLGGGMGHQTVTVFFHHVDKAWVGLTVKLVPSAQKLEDWRTSVWSALYNAAQTRYFTLQQDIQNQIAQLQQQLENVDTLTLRREESDEVMKNVLRFLLGAGFEFMPDAVLDAIKKSGGDPNFGVGFTGNKIKMTGTELALVRQYEDVVRFINQAIEWENVATFLYSYFWDVPPSWGFIRQLRHPDATRQAFLRAGSARVVLTIRKGWEARWVRFQDTGNPNGSSTSPYLSIAQEIAAYDDRNYPGIPPANPGRSAVRLEDAIYTTSSSNLSPGAGPVTIDVESSAGIVPGRPVVIDAYQYPNSVQETQTVTEVPSDTQIVVQRLDHAHGGSGPYPIVQPGDKGVLIAEWQEYTPTSGTDIAVTSNLATVR